MPSPSSDSRENTEEPGPVDSLKGSFARELRLLSSPPTRLEAGQVLADRYRILRHLGHGGMGDVYLAEHILDPALQYAIKILRPNMVRETAAQVLREASNIAKVRHRHVVRVTDVGMPSDDVAFLVMEYVGQDLGAYAKAAGGVLPPHQAVNFCAQVCDALSAAHGQRIVHRDIKPSNCLVHTEDGNEYIVVTDFGLARLLHGEDSTFSEWSKVGSTGYIAPEIQPGLARPDQRVDIYSVGAMLCCLIIGAPPPPFSTDRDSAKEYLRPVPRALLPILTKALAFDPKRRYSSAKEMASALRQALPLLPQENPSKPPAPPFSRTAIMVSLVAVVALIAFLAFAVQFARYLEGPSIQPLTTPPPEIEHQTTPPAAVNGPPVSETASAQPPPDIDTPTPTPTPIPNETLASPPTKAVSNKYSGKKSKQSTVIDPFLVDIPSEDTLDKLCRWINHDCSAQSSMKQEPRYSAPGALKATLTFTLQSEKGIALITAWGGLGKDLGFRTCAYNVTTKAMETLPIKRGIGTQECKISM